MVPINTKSAFSLLESPMLPQELVQTAQEQGYQAVALTDQNVLYGMDNFYRAATKAGIKPILGITSHLRGVIQTAQTFPIILLVENQTGYQNLLAISSLLETSTTVPALTDLVAQLAGLYVVMPPLGELEYLLNTEIVLAQQAVEILLQAVDQDHLLLGMSLQMANERLQQIANLANGYHLRYIAADPVEVAKMGDGLAQTTLQFIKRGEAIANLAEVQRQKETNWLQPAELMQSQYAALGFAAATENTDWLAEHSQFELAKTKVTLPTFETPRGQTSIAYLQELAEQGLRGRLQFLPDGNEERYQQRLRAELQEIEEMGFADYFLIIWDVLNFAHQNDIRTGPGRGSAAGSLVAYSLWITDVDPVQYDLLFERFLNPARAQMPDIDIDVPDNRREEILAYLHEKYGHERFAQIITFSTLGMRAVVRDVARVFGLNPRQIDQLAKALPNEETLQAAFDQHQGFRNVLLDLPIDEHLFLQVANKLVGLPRNKSLHAAGIILSAAPLVETVPVELGEDGRLVTQLTKNPVEDLGLLKMDFLALSNLTILDIAVKEVQKTDVAFDIERIDLNDETTLKIFQVGRTNGVFQFESAGMKQMLQQLKPDRFEDIVAANALFRPGPSQNMGHFIARKHGQEPQQLPDEHLRDILAPTYGIIVYQEQVMRVAEQFAGFTLAEADLLRRAISKKDAEKLEAVKRQFIEGAVARDHTLEVATEVYGYIETFAQYGFNRSHAVAYAKLAVQLAYLKVHYPGAFYKAVLNRSWGDKKKSQVYLAEAKAAGVGILGPDINNSWQGFTINHGKLQMGLGSITGLRSDMREAMLDERRLNGPFKDLTNLIGRLPNQFHKLDLIMPLAVAGALDSFGPNRRSVVESLNGFIEAVGLAGESMNLFQSFAPKMRQVDEYPLQEKLALEHDVLGMYVSGHPLESVREQLPRLQATDVSDLVVGMNNVSFLYYVQGVKVIRTKKGEQMAFLDGGDLSGNISVTIFPTIYRQLGATFKEEQILLIQGKVEQRPNHDEIQVVANRIQFVDQLVAQSEPATGRWFLRVQTPEQERQLAQLLKKHPGNNPVVVVSEFDGKRRTLPNDFWLKQSETVKSQLIGMLGQENVVFKLN